MKTKSRSLAVCNSYLNVPIIWLRGAYLWDYGFDPGDQTEVTNPEPGKIIITIKTPAAEMNNLRHKRLLELRWRKLKEDQFLTEAQLIKLHSLDKIFKAA
jgi:hypothetical protein